MGGANEGFHRLAVLAAVVAGPVWMLYILNNGTAFALRNSDIVVEAIAAVIISAAAWGLVRLLGWVVQGFAK